MSRTSTGDEDGDPAPLRLTQAARLLGVPTIEVVRAVTYRRIAYRMVDGIAHIPPDSLEAFRRDS